MYCTNCDKPENQAEKIISGGDFLYDDEGEWVCSEECWEEVEKERTMNND